MKRILEILAIIALAGGIAFADWIEPYGANCTNTGYWGTLNCVTFNVNGTSAGILTIKGYEANDAYITLSADESDDNGDDWKIESDLTTNSLITSNDTSGSQVAKSTLDTSGNLLLAGSRTGTVDAQGNTVYQVNIATTLAIGFSYSVTPASGKAGMFDIIAGTHSARGTFTTAGAVTLAQGTGDIATTDTSTKFSVYDGGTNIAIKNNTEAALATYIRILFVN